MSPAANSPSPDPAGLPAFLRFAPVPGRSRQCRTASGYRLYCLIGLPAHRSLLGIGESFEGDRRAVLMANHGSLAVGGTIAQAADRLEVLEWLCEVHLRASEIAKLQVVDVRVEDLLS